MLTAGLNNQVRQGKSPGTRKASGRYPDQGVPSTSLRSSSTSQMSIPGEAQVREEQEAEAQEHHLSEAMSSVRLELALVPPVLSAEPLRWCAPLRVRGALDSIDPLHAAVSTHAVLKPPWTGTNPHAVSAPP